MATYYFTKYVGPTTTKGSRIRVTFASERSGKFESKHVPWDYSMTCAHTAAVAEVAGVPYLKVERLAVTPSNDGYVLRVN